MPAHIYQRTGNYAGAAKANEAAADADRKFVAKHGNEGIYALMYYNHNLQFGSASYLMDGRFADAKRLGDEFGANATAAAKEMPMLESAAATPSSVVYCRTGERSAHSGSFSRSCSTSRSLSSVRT